MRGDTYGIALIIPPEKTISEVYEMKEALFSDKDFAAYLSEDYEIYPEGLYLTVEYHDVEGRSMVEYVESLGFVINWDEMAEWEPYASEFEGEDE